MKFLAKGPQTGSTPEETGNTLTLHLITDFPVCNKRQIKGFYEEETERILVTLLTVTVADNKSLL